MQGPVPSSSNLLSELRSSCEEIRIKSNILFNDKAIDEFILGIEESAWEKEGGANQNGIRLPLKFDSPEEELNLISTLSLLNFLSGYRTVLHRLTNRGAWSTILSLVLSAHLSSAPNSTPLTTQGMISSSPASLASLTQIVTHIEKDHPTMGSAVRVGEKDEEAWEVLELLAGVLNETGTILKGLGKKNLGEWIKEALLETLGGSEEMIEKLATTFPAFRDSYLIDGQPVYLFKKALFLLTAITLRFSPKPNLSEEDQPPYSGDVHFPLPAIAHLPIFADNVIPTMLIHYNLLNLSNSTNLSLSTLKFTSTPEPAGHSLSLESATILRASSLSLCAHLIKRAHILAVEVQGKEWLAAWREVELDGYLWGVAKRGELRDVGRIEERNTVYY